jgi:copper oxidase (laccase) domain-containing protein
VVGAVKREMSLAGHQPVRAEVGPGIGACCFEVGAGVNSKFRGFSASTTWETPSVDLAQAISVEISDLDVWFAGGCTMHDSGWFSHRSDATPMRLATIGWRE